MTKANEILENYQQSIQLSLAKLPVFSTAHYTNYCSYYQEQRQQLTLLGKCNAGFVWSQCRYYLMFALLQKIGKAWLGKRVTLLAIGGFARGYLNPYSDVDLLFVIEQKQIAEQDKQDILQFVQLLWDMKIKISYFILHSDEIITKAQQDIYFYTALLQQKIVLVSSLSQLAIANWQKELTTTSIFDFFNRLKRDIIKRHNKYENTVYLQEPHLKDSCGNMRDFDCIYWLLQLLCQSQDWEEFKKKKIFLPSAFDQLMASYHFLHLVRNNLQLITQQPSNILSLRLQGEMADKLNYQQADVLQRCEAFMRDYYRHTRFIYQHLLQLMQYVELKQEDKLLADNTKAQLIYANFIVRGRRVYYRYVNIFKENKMAYLQLFQILAKQQKLVLSPTLQRLYQTSLQEINTSVLAKKIYSLKFVNLLQQRGQVYAVLRRMHRYGFLGFFLPEFGKLDSLVQHEFFHRYTADEHTLRCIFYADEVANRPNHKYYTIYQNITAIEALYLALLLHDTGRAANSDDHVDISVQFTQQACARMSIAKNNKAAAIFLVKEHLTLWRYATTQNIDDEEVIIAFANIVQTVEYLNLLFIFTYADSKGTSQDGWNSWKESLLWLLYQKTQQYLVTKKVIKSSFPSSLKTIQSSFPVRYQQLALDHIKELPLRYYQQETTSDILQHLMMIEQLQQGRDKLLTNWHYHTETQNATLIIVTHDQQHLLAKITAIFTQQHLSIQQANLYTRKDNIACNKFILSSQVVATLKNTTKQKLITQQLQHILDNTDAPIDNRLPEEPFLYQSLANTTGLNLETHLKLRLQRASRQSSLEVCTPDKIGLLLRIFTILSHFQLAVTHARIATEHGMAINTIYFQLADNKLLKDAAQKKKLKATILQSIRNLSN